MTQEQFQWSFGRCFYPLMRKLIKLAGAVVLLSGAAVAKRCVG